MEEKSKVYILTDLENRILRCEGGYTISNIQNIEDWIFIDEGTGDKYNLCQSHYFNDGLYTEDGICQYVYEEGAIRLRTNEEIEADRTIEELVPTKLDRIEAQITYTAMMTDTLLEV